jgi:hypothetical protein
MEGGVMKLSVAVAAIGVIVAVVLGTAAASGSAKSPTSLFHASVVGGHYKLSPLW